VVLTELVVLVVAVTEALLEQDNLVLLIQAQAVAVAVLVAATAAQELSLFGMRYKGDLNAN
jgi:hypothetical protein